MATKETNASWRELRVTLQPGLNDIVFPDTRPNHININNLGASTLYTGVSVIPDTVTHEKMIEAKGENMIARQNGTDRFKIYNAGTGACIVLITSFIAEFNPATMTGNTITVSGTGGSGGSTVIAGFGAALPAGANNIGKVEVTKMPAQTFSMAELPAGVNNIGKVNVATLPPLPAGASEIGSVKVTNGLTIASMPPVSLNGNVTLSDTTFDIKSKDAFYTHNASVGITDLIITFPFPINLFKFISNDDPINDLIIAFNAGLTTDSQTAANGVIVLKAGETLSELNVKATSITLKRAAGAGNVRLLGV